MRIKAISVRSATDEYVIKYLLPTLKEYYDSIKQPDTQIDFALPTRGARLIDQEYWESLYASHLLEIINEVDESVYDGVMILCMLDPCLTAAKERLRIPVVGLLQSSLALAHNLGRRVSIIQPKPTSSLVPGAAGNGGGAHLVKDKAILYGLDRIMVSTQTTSITGLESDRTIEEQRRAILDASRRAVEDDGADVLILGCGAMFGMADFLKKELGVPVIDPNAAALMTLETLIKMGLSQSKMAYPRPNLEALLY